DVDLSEQHPTSCAMTSFYCNGHLVTLSGCCGGSASVFEFLVQFGLIWESDLSYDAGDASGPRQCAPSISLVPCESPSLAPWHLTDWHMLPQTGGTASVADIKSALVHGPVWTGFAVYQDFMDFWSGGNPTPYVRESAVYLGLHAVLIVGYDDSGDGYFICKNSWGNGGPNGDGTFNIAYEADCNFGRDASWADVAPGAADPGPERACCSPSGSCVLMTARECETMGGTWHSDWESCAGNPCLNPPEPDEYACCIGEACQILTQDECDNAGGEWQQGVESCDPDPCGLSGPVDQYACCIGEECQVLNQADCNTAGGQWQQGVESCDPNPCEVPPTPATAVCCLLEECFLFTEVECTELNGEWLEGTESCDPNPCYAPPPPPEGVCCISGSCSLLTEEACLEAGGEFHGDLDSCDSNPCSPPDPECACCFDEACQIMTEIACGNAGGTWRGEDPCCDPNPCSEGPAGVHQISWGALKAQFLMTPSQNSLARKAPGQRKTR
ncbi:MAG: C1 family peptidase, partial [Candidatus Eisenbacteria sp.]|nr:C1 family peptidase [Candidatus Eisenbacteria bacterium]